ncbi:23S rRNA (guanosine(2251)-2'-O)-methyltransferase RlmB [bacterium]|nr:23S rRNA (guanosine(2251)-2'-O)-methyltransferase RlmB [bacterium]
MNIIGRKPVLEALEGDTPVRRVAIALGTQGRIIGQIIKAAKVRGIRVDRIPQNRIAKEFGNGNHQGVLAEVSPTKLYSLNDLGTTIPIKNNLLIALDGITDPFHLGAVARSARAAGCDALIMQDRRSAPLSEVAVKASAGHLTRIPIIQVTNISDTILSLKNMEWWIYGLAGEGAKSLWKHDWDGKICLVLGSEGKGLATRVENVCDQLISIPMLNGVESLSASSAASVVLFEVSRQHWHKENKQRLT